MLDRIDGALTAARNAYPRLLREGDHHRMLAPLALIAALRGRVDDAARIAAFDRAVQARSGENPSVVAPLLHARLDPLLERPRLDAHDAALTGEEAFRLALA
jgi:hypothetical protein